MSLQNRADKKRLNIIIVAEGAIDSHNKAITPDYIKDVSMVEKPGLVMDSNNTRSPTIPPIIHSYPMCFCTSDFTSGCSHIICYSPRQEMFGMMSPSVYLRAAVCQNIGLRAEL